MLEEQIFALKKASESRLESLKKEAVAVRASRLVTCPDGLQSPRSTSLTACVTLIKSFE
jgi:alkylhydroperoxidase family enzyme